MAGTTVDEDNVVYKTVQKALLKNGYPFDLEEVLEVAAGQEKLNAIREMMQLIDKEDFDEENAKRIHKEFVEMLKGAYTDLKVRPCFGAEILFDYLRERDVKIALNTGYSREIATSLLEKLNWKEGEMFDYLVTASDVQRMRPFPDMIHLAMEKLGVSDSREVIKVGDSAIDIEEGKSANVGKTVGLTTGAQTRRQLAKASPDFIFENIRQVLEIL